jgi:hypothetical protein
MRQDIDHRQAPVRQELLKYINMMRAEITAKMVPEPVALSVALSHATAMRRRLHPVGTRVEPARAVGGAPVPASELLASDPFTFSRV